MYRHNFYTFHTSMFFRPHKFDWISPRWGRHTQVLISRQTCELTSKSCLFITNRVREHIHPSAANPSKTKSRWNFLHSLTKWCNNTLCQSSCMYFVIYCIISLVSMGLALKNTPEFEWVWWILLLVQLRKSESLTKKHSGGLRRVHLFNIHNIILHWFE